MARAARKGDTSYNARRREYRAAQRYLKRANETTGATAEKNRALARTHYINAINTYDFTSPKQNISNPMLKLGEELGIDTQARRDAVYSQLGEQPTKEQISKLVKRQNEAIGKSYEALESTRIQQRTELEAKELVNNKVIGRRIMGGLVDVWRDEVVPGSSALEVRQAKQKALFDYFKVSSWAEILEKLERFIGKALYSISGDLEIYETVKLALQKGVTGNTLVV